MCADELILKEGKVLQGTIIQENQHEYTLRMASNMILRVDKDKVNKVVRSTPPKQTRPTVRMDSLVAPAVSTATSHATSISTAAAKPVPTPAPPAIAQAKSGSQFQITKKESVSIQRTLAVNTYPVKGPRFKGLGRNSSQTTWDISWNGEPEKDAAQTKWKWAVVQATITTPLPAWDPSAKPDEKEIADWNAFLADASTHVYGESQVYEDSLTAFAEALAAERADNEADLRRQGQDLFESIKQNTAKKMKGYERRESNKRVKPSE